MILRLVRLGVEDERTCFFLRNYFKQHNLFLAGGIGNWLVVYDPTLLLCLADPLPCHTSTLSPTINIDTTLVGSNDNSGSNISTSAKLRVSGLDFHAYLDAYKCQVLDGHVEHRYLFVLIWDS